jgi:hypothetical protein
MYGLEMLWKSSHDGLEIFDAALSDGVPRRIDVVGVDFGHDDVFQFRHFSRRRFEH